MGKSRCKSNYFPLGDYHLAANKENQVNDIQQDIIIKFAKELNAIVIVEDGKTDIREFKKDPLRYNRNTYCEFAVDEPSKTTLLLGLTMRCQEDGVTVNNVEFRFPDLSTSTQMLVQKLDQIKQKISSYDDGPILNSYYHDKLQELYYSVEKPCKNLFMQLGQGSENLATMASKIRYHHSYNRALDYLWQNNGLYVQDDTVFNKIYYIITGVESKLLDLEILHAIAEQKNRRHIIICAGASHLNSIKPALEALGFTRTHTNIPSEKGCIINGSYIEPQALDIEKALIFFYKDDGIVLTQKTGAVESTDFSFIGLCTLVLVAIVCVVAVIKRMTCANKFNKIIQSLFYK